MPTDTVNCGPRSNAASTVLDLVVCMLASTGVLFIYSTGHVGPEWAVLSPWPKQVVWVALGGVLYAMAGRVGYDAFRRAASAGYLVGLLLLVLVLFIGVERHGARRWLPFFGVTFQPSELAKLTTLYFLAVWLSERPDGVPWYRNGLLACLIVVVPFLLILIEPSLGASLTLVPAASVMVAMALFPSRWLTAATVTGIVSVALVLAILFVPEFLGLETDTWRTFLSEVGVREYQLRRIESFINGEGWNEIQSRIAVSTGGLFGKGFLQGTQKALGYLPRTVAPTDFIFAVIAEETGFVGCSVVLLLYSVLCVIGLGAAARAPDRLGRLLCVGVITLLYTHIFVNISMTIGLLPVTGLPLPLLSYGGSFTVTTLLGLGLVRSVCAVSCRDIASVPAPAKPVNPPRTLPVSGGKLIQLEFKL